MSPLDERHGTRRGYYAHRADGEAACDPCKRAAAAAEQRYVLARMKGRTGRVPAVGTKRRLRALQALGWTLTELAERMGSQRSRVEKWCSEDKTYVYASTAARVAKVYEELCMTQPTGRWATRTRNMARRNGYPPPLAWDRIDDPAETPKGWEYVGGPRKSRADVIADLDEQHATITDVCRVLKVSRAAVERWCQRNDERDLYRRLVERETPRYWANQWGEGGAA